MPNPETDALELVNTSSVTGGRWFFPAKVGPDVGFSLQVFRPGGEYRGSVDDGGVAISARDGDTVLRINLGQHALPMKGEIKTNDEFIRKYEATVIVEVVDPETFAICYRQSTDPVGRARKALDADLTRWAERLKHDDITEPMMRFRLENALNRVGPAIGMRVVEAEKVMLHVSDHHATITEIERTGEVTQVRRRNDAFLEQEARDKLAKDRVVDREQVALDAELKRHERAQDTVVEALVDVYVARLKRLLEDGFTLEQIRKNEPELMSALTQLASASHRANQAIGASDGPTARNDVLGSVFGVSGDGDGERIVDQEDIYYSDRLGARLRQVGLDEQQENTIEDLDVQQAFEIIEMDVGGPAHSAQLAAGDIIVQICGQKVQDKDAVKRLFSGTPMVTVSVLRDGELLNKDVAVAQ